MAKPKNIYKARSLSVSVFENTKDEHTYKSYKIQRAYKDKEKDEFKYTDQIRGEDLAVLAGLLQRVFEKEETRRFEY